MKRTTPNPALQARGTPGRRRAAVLQTALRGWSQRHDPRLRLQVALALLFLAAAAAFAHVVEDYLTGDPIVRWDVELSRWIHAHSSDWLLSVAKVVTWAGNLATLAVVTLLAAWLLVRRARVDEAVLVCVSSVGIEVLNAVLKLVFHRPRPELAYVHLDTYSFPSGHAAGAAAIYGVVLYLLVRRRSRRARIAAAVAYVLLVTIVCLSRLYLEVHYFSDVVAGSTLGLAWAAGWLFVYEHRLPDSASRFPPRVRTLLARVARAEPL